MTDPTDIATPAETEIQVAEELVLHPPLTAREIMTTPARTIGVTATISHAWSAMLAEGHRHLVVCDGTRCVGVLDDRTLFAQWPNGPLGPAQTPIAHLVRSRTSCALPNTSAKAVAEIMVRDSIDVVPVVDPHGKVIGVITGSDLARAVAEHGLTPRPEYRP